MYERMFGTAVVMGGKQKKKEAAAERQHSGGRERKGKGRKHNKGEDDDDGAKQVPKAARANWRSGRAKSTTPSWQDGSPDRHQYRLTHRRR
ncbi:hypothetical protein Pcinc_032084 [Petrolisthes cinctipes]|uniref:Uncharacterized protein n=1 Tax=Petrolisthes cinctipes TaxID=88211 RepID=A0AAE1K3L8_PETCI|nr:hypothetical protein Pcinc_032084 [Petrolisthes cinctipes]